MADYEKTLWTPGRIAKHFDVEQHQITYLIKSRGIMPIGRAGSARVFDTAAVNQIKSELKRIDTIKRGAVNAK